MHSDNFENLTTEQKILKAAQKEFSQKALLELKLLLLQKQQELHILCSITISAQRNVFMKRL